MPPTTCCCDGLHRGTADRPARLVVFDFDQTLSCVHVFKILAGWEQEQLAVDPPFALTEWGQVRRIFELNATEPFNKNGGFALAAFGGPDRVKMLRRLLCLLADRGVKVVICTRGLTGTVKKCLHDVGLDGLISEVFGNTADCYGQHDYDEEIAFGRTTSTEQFYAASSQECRFEWDSKDKLIEQVMLEFDPVLDRSQVIFVDDDAQEIEMGQRVSRTIWVSEAEGITPEHCQMIGRWTQPKKDKKGSKLPKPKEDSRTDPPLNARTDRRSSVHSTYSRGPF
mmetsp:Transcript_9333/g.20766  ORF Transcript_9333/g.20766 Transcript_9333/m.20766 type:complete len:282 (+) Transcript_9333:77-922(+)